MDGSDKSPNILYVSCWIESSIACDTSQCLEQIYCTKNNVHFPINQSFVDKSDSVNRGFYQNKQKKHSKNKYEHINTTQYADHNIFAEKQ